MTALLAAALAFFGAAGASPAAGAPSRVLRAEGFARVGAQGVAAAREEALAGAEKSAARRLGPGAVWTRLAGVRVVAVRRSGTHLVVDIEALAAPRSGAAL